MAHETFHDRLMQLLGNTGQSVIAVSEAAGLHKDTLGKLVNNPKQAPSPQTIRKLANHFGVSSVWLADGSGLATEAQAQATSRSSATQSDEASVPVMGTAAGSLSKGAFKFEGGAIDYVPRPPALPTARDLYALYVEGDSMEPQYFAGQIIYVSPHRPAREGDVVVVQALYTENGTEEASLGILKKPTDKTIVIGKRNPAASIEFPKSYVRAVHRVFTYNELFGA